MAFTNTLEARLRASAVYKLIPEKMKFPWLQRCLDLPVEWLITPPTQGRSVPGEEVFDSVDDVRKRMLAYGFASGSYFTTESSTGTRLVLHCQFHSTKTSNRRRLQDDRVRFDDATGQVISDRKRNTNHSRLGCGVLYIATFRGEKGEVKRWHGSFRVGPDEHACKFPMNPLLIVKFKRSLEQWAIQNELAVKLRVNHLKYAAARSILEADGDEAFLTSKEYYNLIRKRPLKDVPVDDTGRALLDAINQAGGRYSLRTEDDKVNGVVISRKILQIAWYHEDAVAWAQRLTSGSLVVADATFRTNEHGFPLIIATARSPFNTIFPFAFSWCPSESAESWKFFWDYLRQQFYNRIPEPDVVLVDLGPSNIKSVDVYEALP